VKITWVDASDFHISAVTPICGAGSSTVTVTSTSLITGSYTVTYNTTNPPQPAVQQQWPLMALRIRERLTQLPYQDLHQILQLPIYFCRLDMQQRDQQQQYSNCYS
jgi:hypothetical protein